MAVNSRSAPDNAPAGAAGPEARAASGQAPAPSVQAPAGADGNRGQAAGSVAAGAGMPPAEPAGADAAGQSGAAPAGEPKAAPLYAFRIELKGVRPKIWRHFFCPSDLTLDDLHRVICRAMGWHGEHGYSFLVSHREYCGAAAALDESELDLAPAAWPTSTTLDRLGLARRRIMRYNYDFGDMWIHELRVVSLDYRPPDPAQRYGCRAGAGACPPEDCGGPWGYRRLLEILADPGHPRHRLLRRRHLGHDPGQFRPGDIHPR